MLDAMPMPTDPAAAFAGKSVLLTGGTGFLGKAVLEKLLRCCPNIETIFVLIRPRKGVEAAARLEKEIVNSAIFDRLRSEREDFDAFARAKLHAIAGDVTSPMLGLSDDDQRMLRHCVQIAIHMAATVQFNEPLEVAVEMNCVGALHALEFVQTCPRLACHLHVSTAYVNSNLRVLQVREELYPLEFDVEEALEAVVNASPNDLERLHANLMGTYPNTYALTKSMAEHLILHRVTPNFPLVLFRPTIIGAAWKEPVPGWTDQIAAAGAVFLACGMGVLTILPGNPRNIADLVPVDLVVNRLLLACCAKLYTPPADLPKPFIVHCGTSDPRQNPLRWRVALRIVPEYFRRNPPQRGLFPAKFHMISTHQQFQLEWFLKYALPSSAYSTVANAVGNAPHMRQAARLWRLTWRARNIVEAFKPFTESQWIFETDALQFLAPFVAEGWWIDAKEIVWERYIFNYCVGLKKYALHEKDVVSVDIAGVTHTELALSAGRMLEWDPDHHAISFPRLLSDVTWVYTSSRKPGYTKSGILGRVLGLTGWREGVNHEASHVPRAHVDTFATVRNHVLEAAAVREAIQTVSNDSGRDLSEVERDASEMLTEMAAQIDYKSVRTFAWVVRKLLRRLYQHIDVDEQGLTRVRELLHARQGSVVLVSTHRSYMDFLLISYLCFAFNMPVPHIAAANDFLHLGALTKLMRESGAYFIRRASREDRLNAAVFAEYTQYLLSQGHVVEFFMEGTRSRSGKQLSPKLGLLRAVVDCYLAKRVDNIFLVPVTIDYEKPLEVMLHQRELLGQRKPRESLRTLLQALPAIQQHFGSIAVQFAKPIDLRAFAAAQAPTASTPIARDPLVHALAYEVTNAMVASATCMPLHLVATLLLLYRQGIAHRELVTQTDWLRSEIVKRGGRVMGTQGRALSVLVDDALQLMNDLVERRRAGVIEPAITAREQYGNMLGLGYFRNKLLHWFHLEGVLACAFHALQQAHDTSSSSVSTSNVVGREELLQAALFLHGLLQMEVVRADTTQDRPQLEHALDRMLEQRVLCYSDDSAGCSTLQRGGSDGDALFALLCTLLWPFVDSYWVTLRSLSALCPSVEMRADALHQRVQWLAETMYHERVIAFYESCSLETIQNALTVLERWQVLERVVVARSASPAASSARRARSNASPPPTMTLLRLRDNYQQHAHLEALAARVARFRKRVPSATADFAHESHLIAHLPAMSKL